MIKNTTHSSIGCNGMANNDDYHGLEMYKNSCKGLNHRGIYGTRPNHHGMWLISVLKVDGFAHPMPVMTLVENKRRVDPKARTQFSTNQVKAKP